MGRRVYRLGLLWLAFTVEVQIHASSKSWLSEPPHCTPHKIPCAMRALSEKAQLTWEELQVVAGRTAALVWFRPRALEVVAGSVLMDVSENVEVKAANAFVRGQGQVLVERLGSEVEITCLSGELSVRPRGAVEALQLPAGYRVHIGLVGRDGVAITELPLSAPLNETLRKWWQIFPGPKLEFLPLAKEFIKTVKANVTPMSDWQNDLVHRALASQAQAEELARQRRAAQERENLKMRQLFRKLNYVGEETPD